MLLQVARTKYSEKGKWCQVKQGRRKNRRAGKTRRAVSFLGR